MIDKKSIVIILLSIILTITLIYFVGVKQIGEYCTKCKEEGIKNSLQLLINEIKMRGTAVQISVGSDILICDRGG